MINKVVNSVEEAIEGVADNMTLMLGGFGLCGIPENSIRALSQSGVRVNVYFQQCRSGRFWFRSAIKKTPNQKNDFFLCRRKCRV